MSGATTDDVMDAPLVIHLHRGLRLVYADRDLRIHDVEPGTWLVSPDGERGRVEAVYTRGICAVSSEESEEDVCVEGWTVEVTS